MRSYIFLSFFSIFLLGCDQKATDIIELSDFDIHKEIVSPKNYVVYKVSEPLKIDGKDDETDWQNASFTDDFIDIEGVKIPNQKTHVKMLWDDHYLYIYAKLYEKHIWGDITQRDAVIFYNNDFEVFISPSDDTHNYGEIEINALG